MMKHTTIGLLAGAATSAIGVLLIHSGVSDANTNKQESTGSRVKGILGGTLLIAGIGTALGSGIKALSDDRLPNPIEKVIEYRGWRITSYDATQLGYRVSPMRPGKGRKDEGYLIHYPDSDATKFMKTLTAAKKYIDDY